MNHLPDVQPSFCQAALSPDRILDVFDDLGMRNTRPRRAIAERLAALGASGHDFTVHELCREIQGVEPSVGRATVYRMVDVLVNRGVLDRVPVADGTHRYRLCGDEHHHHLRCNRCHRVVEIDACLPPELFAAVAESTDFTIEGHALELYGRCAACRTDGSTSL